MSQVRDIQSAAAGAGVAARPRSPEREKIVKPVMTEVLTKDAEFQRYGGRNSESVSSGWMDYIFATPTDPYDPKDVFENIRWGGIFFFIGKDRRQVEEVFNTYKDAKSGFVIDRPMSYCETGMFGLKLPFLKSKIHYFSARKVHLIRPGEKTDRFTYQVQLAQRDPKEGFVVQKQIPDYDYVMWRLRQRFPDVGMETVAQRVRKLVDSVFPVLLTRETAILNILQRDMPEEYRNRIPRVLHLEKDAHGFVRKLYLNWMRLGSAQPLGQLEFAKQSASLLHILQDVVGVMHLDLRLDNMLITQDGVCFIDFGSAVRIGEDLSESRMLRSLFREMMTTSEIQRMLGKMKETGRLTSRVIIDGHQKVDKVIDFFYLALQWNDPHQNPDFKNLVTFDPKSPEAQLLSKLTDEIMRPPDPANPIYKSAEEILRGVERIEAQVKGKK